MSLPDWNEKVIKVVTEKYDTKRLCPKCGGLIEKENRVSCKMCSLAQHIKTNLEIAGTALMRIEHEIREKTSR